MHSLSTEEAQSGVMQNLAAEMKALRAEVAELRSQRPASGPESGKPRYGGRGCSSCRQKGVARSCRHCWMCGADDHDGIAKETAQISPEMNRSLAVRETRWGCRKGGTGGPYKTPG